MSHHFAEILKPEENLKIHKKYFCVPSLKF